MRQVTYSRPKDWVDPFAQSDPSPTNVSLASHKARPSTVCSSSPSRHSIASSRGGKSSHVSRLKILKQSQSAASAFSRAASREETLGEGNLEDEIKRNFTDLGDDHEDLADIYEEDEFDDHSCTDNSSSSPFIFLPPLTLSHRLLCVVEVDHLLAQCTRKIFVNVLDDPVVTQSRPVMRRDSSCRTMIVPSTQSPSPSQLQQQQSSSNSDSSAPNTPTQTTESGRRTFTSSSSRRNLFADIHQAHQSFRSIPSFHHTNSTPLSAAAGNGGPAAPILNVSQFKQTSNSIRYEISVEIRCSLTENNLLLLEILGVDDKSVHAELEFHPYDLIGKSPKPSSPTHDDSGGEGGVTSTSTNTIIPTQHDHVPYNWTFPNDRTLQVNLGLGIVQGIQLCVRGGQEYLIALPDPTTLVFEVDPETEKTGQEGDGQAYSDQDALKILQGLLSANSLPYLLPLTDATLEFDPISVSASALIPMEVFYPIISSPVRQISGLTRQKTGWNEIKTQFLFKPENIGMLLKVKRISEEKAIISGLVVRDSINRFINPMTRKSTPAISRDSNLEITISMPSILCIDNELITDYFRNAVNYIRIKHNGTTGENKLVFEE
jgi:hypothetical protein